MPELKHTQAKRLYEAIRAAKGADAADAILDELPLAKAPGEKQKHAWAVASCAALVREFGADAAREIRKSCLCKPAPSRVAQMKKAWAESRDPADFAARAAEASDGAFAMEAGEGFLVLVYPCCYCSLVKRGARDLPAQWCDCSLGYAENLFSQALERPVRASLLESVVTGGEKCRIRLDY